MNYYNGQPSYGDYARGLAGIGQARSEAARQAGRMYEAGYYDQQQKNWLADGARVPGAGAQFGFAPQIFQTPETMRGMIKNPAADATSRMDPEFMSWIERASGGRSQVPTWYTTPRGGGDDEGGYEMDAAPRMSFSPMQSAIRHRMNVDNGVTAPATHRNYMGAPLQAPDHFAGNRYGYV